MIRRACLVSGLMVLVLALPVAAGAWLRAEGSGFFSLSSSTTYSLDSGFAGYLEYGLAPKTTVGADLDLTMRQGLAMSGTLSAFVRRPISLGDRPARMSYQIGLGARISGSDISALAKTTLSYGRSLTWKDRNGWVNVDTGVEWDLDGSNHIGKIDATLGMALGARAKGMFQVFWAIDSGGNTSTTLAPSYIYTPKNGKTIYVVGLEAKRSTTQDYGLKFSVWREF